MLLIDVFVYQVLISIIPEANLHFVYTVVKITSNMYNIFSTNQVFPSFPANSDVECSFSFLPGISWYSRMVCPYFASSNINRYGFLGILLFLLRSGTGGSFLAPSDVPVPGSANICAPPCRILLRTLGIFHLRTEIICLKLTLTRSYSLALIWD
jgi:hypothetical protein